MKESSKKDTTGRYFSRCLSILTVISLSHSHLCASIVHTYISCKNIQSGAVIKQFWNIVRIFYKPALIIKSAIMPKRKSDTSVMGKANSGKKKYYCSWKPEWFLEEVNQGLVGLKNDSQRVECTYCCTTFSVKYGGKNCDKSYRS